MRIKIKKRGVTLIELIISIAILSIIIAPIGSMVVTSAKINKSSENRQKGTYNGQRILEQIKAFQEDNITDLGEAIATNLGMIKEDGDTEGWIYYDKDWILTNEADARYKVKINLADRAHQGASVNSIYNTFIINDINPSNYIRANSNTVDRDFTIYNSEIRLKLYKEGDNFKLSIDSYNDPNDAPNVDMVIDNCFDLRFLFNTTNHLRIVAENNTEKSLNLYIDKPQGADANYSIVNSIGWVNKIYNSSPVENYSEIKNSIQVDIKVYDKDGLELAEVTGYKNL